MSPFVILLIAIVSEIIGTAALKGSEGLTKPLPSILFVVSYGAALFFMALALKNIPLSITYAVWSGLGTIGTVIIGVWIWREPINLMHVLAIGLIIVGVVMLNYLSQTQAV